MQDPGTANRFSTRAMGCRFSITFSAFPEEKVYHRQAARAAFDQLDRLARNLDHRLQGSELFRLNRLQCGETTLITPETFRCLELAELARKFTEGTFDIAWQMPPSKDPGSPRPFQLLPKGLRVRAVRTPLRLDLDGIGKGFALDRLAALLEIWDQTDLVLAADRSTLLAAGGSPWPLRLDVPGKDDAALSLPPLREAAVSASGTSVRGKHVKDPRAEKDLTLPWQRLWVKFSTATARKLFRVDEAAAMADALSTAFLTWPKSRIVRRLEQYPGVSVWASDAEQTSPLHPPDPE
jgi:thiamine biosynthesis lipoprotein